MSHRNTTIRRAKAPRSEYAAQLSREVAAACNRFFESRGMPYGENAFRQAMQGDIHRARRTK